MINDGIEKQIILHRLTGKTKLLPTTVTSISRHWEQAAPRILSEISAKQKEKDDVMIETIVCGHSLG